jgi:uncharacterized membrane protein (DUF2068 family)
MVGMGPIVLPRTAPAVHMRFTQASRALRCVTMSDQPVTGGPNPRAALVFLAVIMAAQVGFAGIELFGEPATTATPLQPVLSVAFIAYAALIVAFAFGVWQKTWWAWHAAVATAAAGLGIAALGIVGGDTVEEHFFGMAIDGALLYYLQKSSIKGLFGR